MTDPANPDRRRDDPLRVPLVRETLDVSREEVVTGRVRVSTRVVEEDVPIHETLGETTVRVERHPVGTWVEIAPEPRTEGDRLIVPVVEEVMVKRLRIVEEVHLIRERTTREHEETVTLRRSEVTVEREDGEGERS